MMGGKVCSHRHGQQNTGNKNKMSKWEDLGRLIYLKKRGVVLFLITVKGRSFP